MTTQTMANVTNAIGPNPTVEKLVIYAGFAYNYVHGPAVYREIEASGLDTGTRPIAFADVITTPSGTRAVVRCSVPVPADWIATPGNLWVKGQEIKEGTLPAIFNLSGL